MYQKYLVHKNVSREELWATLAWLRHYPVQRVWFAILPNGVRWARKRTFKSIAKVVDILARDMREVSPVHFVHPNNKLPHFPGCCGVVDTFPIRAYNADGMYSGKYKAPVWKVQVVSNNLGQIGHISGPHQGRESDTTLARTHPSTLPHGMYVLGDKAYISVDGVLPPIKKNNRHFTKRQKKNFNRMMGHYRARIEQVIRGFKVWACFAARWRSHDAAFLSKVVIVIASLRSITTSIDMPYPPYFPF